ncbi:GNAT family N-acetyltransferase [Roseateles sp. GG27B]
MNDLSPLALYQALALRAEVFVVEQQCIYLDPDGADLLAWHLLGYDSEKKLLAVARLLPPLAKGPACAPGARGGGQGRALMQQALQHCERLWPGQPVALNAQAYLLDFYASLGFAPLADSAPYLEDGILHIDMRKGTDT